MESHIDQLFPKGAEADQPSKFETYDQCKLDAADNTHHPALVFVDTLDPGPEGRFNIECYTDVPKGTEKPRPDPLMRRFAELTFEDIARLIPELNRLNEQGAGIFTTVNRCMGQRSNDNVSNIRSVHADVDTATDQQRKVLTESLPPSIVVTSSDPTKLHLYWLLNEVDAQEMEAVGKLNRLLASDYGADKAATDISRILRLPGFKHMKYRHLGQTPIVTAVYNSHIYSLAEVQAAFPPTEPAPIQHQTRQESADTLSKIEAEVVAEMKARCPELWSGRWEQA
jgi:hypothetical protein